MIGFSTMQARKKSSLTGIGQMKKKAYHDIKIKVASLDSVASAADRNLERGLDKVAYVGT